MKLNNKAVVFDVDGTLFLEFENFDKLHVRDGLFKDHLLVRLLDKILWAINSIELFSNRENYQKYRFYIYSVLTFGKLDYVKAYTEYGNSYKYCLERYLIASEINLSIDEIKNLGVVPVAVSNNSLAKQVVESTLNIKCIVGNRMTSRKKLERIISKESMKVLYWIGNNFTDDILTPKLKKIKTIYLGKSKLRKLFYSNYYAKNIFEVTEIIKKQIGLII